jgi:preprotein translocase subunit SecA
LVRKVRAAEATIRNLPSSALREGTEEFRRRLAQGQPVAELLPEAFASVVVAAERTLGMRHFDVQLQGGVELARERIVEMKTGEGKTLVATLPAYLHALLGRGVHVVTVNDYLAARDAEWMGPVYRELGLTVGCVQEVMADELERDRQLRREAYDCDITYVTNSEVVFDYLRDNLAYRLEEVVQRPRQFAIVDEVDLLLIDEAQTPLIISGPGDDDVALVRQADKILRRLREGRHYRVDWRARSAFLTDQGLARVEKELGLDSLTEVDNLPQAHVIYQALQAYGIFEKDVDYIVQDGEILIVDEHTGRVSQEKRYSNGLHQALEAKEGVPVQSEDLTLAKTSYQYYFRGYPGLCGMTGTAYTEREELGKTYFRKVVQIPTHRPMVREDEVTWIYVSLEEKHRAVVEEIQDMCQQGRPVLVGTVSVEESEALSRRLKKQKIPHSVLNARHHDQEADLIAQAGRPGAVTISTNMAGRGTDIMLGGNPRFEVLAEAEEGTDEFRRLLADAQPAWQKEHDRVVAAGGLHVVGTGEHESARLDNQLRGRAGRQGDPGSSCFFVSLDDFVYQRFGQKKVLGQLAAELEEHPDNEPVEDRRIHQALQVLRKKVETENQAIRMDVLKYDAVVHERRETIWQWRRSLLAVPDPDQWEQAQRDLMADVLERAEAGQDEALPPGQSAADEPGEPLSPAERWEAILQRLFGWLPVTQLNLGPVVEREQALDALFEAYRGRRAPLSNEALALVTEWERTILLDLLDRLWPQYLNDLERVEEGIWMRSYANIDPFVEFRREAAVMFGQLMFDIQANALRAWFSLSPDIEEGQGAVAVALPGQRRSRATSPGRQHTPPQPSQLSPTKPGKQRRRRR